MATYRIRLPMEAPGSSSVVQNPRLKINVKSVIINQRIPAMDRKRFLRCARFHIPATAAAIPMIK